MLNVALGNRVSVIGMQQLPIEKVLKMKIELKLRLPCSTKIDLRIEGTPQNQILQDKEQVRDISDAIQKFQRYTINLGSNNKEDYVHTKEPADKIYDQGNVELVGTTSNDENHSMPRVPETHH